MKISTVNGIQTLTNSCRANHETIMANLKTLADENVMKFTKN